MRKIYQLYFGLVFVIAMALSALAQNPVAPDINIIIQPHQVQFTALKAIQELRFQVFDEHGTLVYDSGVLTEPEFKWDLRDGNGGELVGGLYGYKLTIKESGKEGAEEKHGHFIIERAREREADRLWITSQATTGVGTDVQGSQLTAATSNAGTVAGARAGTSNLESRDAVRMSSNGKIDAAKENKTMAAAQDVTGSGTAGRIAKWVNTRGQIVLDDSSITEVTVSSGALQRTVPLFGSTTPSAGSFGHTVEVHGNSLVTPLALVGGPGAMEFWKSGAARSAALGLALPGKAATDSLIFSTYDGKNWVERMRLASNGYVGIGTTSPGTPLTVEGSGDYGVILATNTGTGAGVMGSGNKIGLWGIGHQKGVIGQTSKDTGYGVYGENTSGTGGTGVHGESKAGTGISGTSESGVGVSGFSNSHIAVKGYSPQGTAVNGIGFVTGIGGMATSDNGYGVLGNNPTGKSGIGVYGISVGANGYGVYGENKDLAYGTGVYGIGRHGVRGQGESLFGAGVYGENYKGGFGVFGVSPGGIGVSGSTSSGAAIKGTATSPNGIAGHFVNKEGIALRAEGIAEASVLKITGGADLSEQFEINEAAESATANSPATIKPGLIVSIDPDNPGELVISNRAYDKRVAGIISGAGGVKPGMLMGQTGSIADGKHPVALTGRVYCWANASNGPINPGDLLTTSVSPGYAMKATDHSKAQGAIIGKAMTSLKEGKGLILVLVSLQ